MSKLRLNMMLSLDGFAARPEQSEENPFGIGGMQLNEWLLPLKASARCMATKAAR
jgi:hypothetical protein